MKLVFEIQLPVMCDSWQWTMVLPKVKYFRNNTTIVKLTLSLRWKVIRTALSVLSWNFKNLKY
jgi:hypothetical protein